KGVFCYKRLPFGLKNTRATYQRLIDKVFGSQIGRSIEFNADDMVLKSNSEEEMLAEIKETFGRMRAINLKCNPRKCSFGVEEGIYFGQLAKKQGIREDPSKCKEGPPFHENLEKLHEWKDGSVDNKSKRSLIKNKRMLRATANNGYTNQRNIIYRKKEEKDEGAKRKEPEPENTWKLFIDGASSSDGSRAGLMLVSSEGKEYTYALRFELKTTNNEAEYEALIAGLRIAKEMQIQELAIFLDLQLVANKFKDFLKPDNKPSSSTWK
nr:reverse transcriptase domain-containing protein [Tanacetum cinerariifolium]